jgi:3-hydroxymyristoyl/3-hydroxydecanoyl-(acyl carrier protein) dehydratase
MEKNWLEVSTFGVEEILQVLPHRYPFLLVDRVLEVRTTNPVSIGMDEAKLQQAKKGSFVRAIKKCHV